jgi:hypothetical protein
LIIARITALSIAKYSSDRGFLLLCQADCRLQSYARQNARVRMLVLMRSRVCFLLYDFLILFFPGRMALIIARTTTLIIVIIIMGGYTTLLLSRLISFSRQKARNWHVRVRVRVRMRACFLLYYVRCRFQSFLSEKRAGVCVCMRLCECVCV